MYTISTQLAKAVFNIGDFFYKDNPTESVQIKNGVITYTVGKSSFNKPIDSFFFMCKDWAYKQDYIMGSYSDGLVLLSNKNTLRMIEWRNFNEHPKPYQSEQQEIFDCCQWILDTKGV